MFALGLLLVLVGAALVAAEAHVPSHGALGTGAAVALAAGVGLLVSGAGSAALGRRARRGARRRAGRARARAADRAQGARHAPPARARDEALVGRARRGARAPAPVGRVFVDGALWRARRWDLEGEPPLEPRRPRRGRARQRADADRAPGGGMGGGAMIEAVLVAIIADPGRARVAAGRGVGAGPARVRARGRVPARPDDRHQGPGPRAARARDRPHGARLAAHRHAQRPAAGRDHARQRPRARRRRRLLPRRRPATAPSSQVESFLKATSQIAQTTLRAVLGKADLDTLLSEREQLNEELQKIIDEQTEPWGIKVTTVEIKDVGIPPAMQHAMAAPGAGRARAAREGDQRRGRVPGRRAAGRGRRRDLPEPDDAPAALPADAERDRRRPELDGRVPAADGPDQAAAGGAARARRAGRAAARATASRR